MSVTLSQVVAQNLKRLRIARGETQTECARRISQNGLNWTRDMLASFENGRRETITVVELLLMADAYDVPPAQMFASPEDQIYLTPWRSASPEQLQTFLRRKQ